MNDSNIVTASGKDYIPTGERMLRLGDSDILIPEEALNLSFVQAMGKACLAQEHHRPYPHDNLFTKGSKQLSLTFLTIYEEAPVKPEPVFQAAAPTIPDFDDLPL